MPRAEREYHAIDSRRSFALALAVVVALILYGSLYPFAFFNYVAPARGLRDLLLTWNKRPSLGDLIANILLYLPFGFLAAKTASRLAPPYRILIAFAAGSLLSMSMEYAQLWDLGRFAAMTDVYANSAGALLGGAAGVAFAADLHFSRWTEMRRRPFASVLVLCWLAYRLYPYVPVIDAHKYWHAVKPLWDGPNAKFTDIVPYFASWLGVAALLQSACGPLRSRVALLLLAIAVFCARIAIGDIALSQADVVGGSAALAIWMAWLHARKHRTWMVAIVLAAAILLEGLRPFHFLNAARSFEWMPFWGLLDGAPWTAIPAHMFKFFLYGALVWSLRQSGLRWTAATAAGAVFVFVVHYFQIYLPGRSAEITDTILVLMAGVLMRMLDGHRPPASAEAKAH